MIAMPTLSSHKVMMGKEEIVSLGIFQFFFTEIFIEKSSMFHMTFVQIVSFKLLLAKHRVLSFKTIFKNLPLKNHEEDEAEAWNTCL